MSERPVPVRLDDLAEPRFSPTVLEILDGMAAMGRDADLAPDALIKAATEQEQLTSFDVPAGDAGWRDRMALHVDSLLTEDRISDAGRLILQQQMLQLLTNRLRIADYVARHPDVVDVPITRPIVIVGLPRTGTTHLHNLLAADPALRSLPYWESLEPVAPRAEQDTGDVEARRERTGAGLWLLDEAMPHFKRMHEMTVDHVHEEIQLLAIDMSTMLFETSGVAPAWREAYKARDQRPTYEFLKLCLQVCSHQRTVGDRDPAAQRWVLKSPQHLEQIGPLLEVFPDAVVVFTHRDPASVVVSFVTMGAYSSRLSHEPPIDIEGFGPYWCDRILDLYAGAVRDRDLVPADQSIDVTFDDFMADEARTVASIYERARQPFDAGVRRAMDEFVTAHPRGRHGTVVYDFAPFALDPAEIRTRAGFYTERFAIPLEERWNTH
jgi:hypothetical protein